MGDQQDINMYNHTLPDRPENIQRDETMRSYIDNIRYNKFNSGYKPKHQMLFEYQYLTMEDKEEFFKEIVQPDTYWAQLNQEWNYILEEPLWEVYQFPLLKKEICNMIIEEVEHFNHFYIGGVDSAPDRDPSNYGLQKSNDVKALSDVNIHALPGLKNPNDKPLAYLYDDLQYRYIEPILSHVWKKNVKGTCWPWVSKYEAGGMEFLEPHNDDCTCASILTLNDGYEGGGTWFERKKVTVDPPTGWVAIHPSQLTHRHAAKRVTKGKRYVLVAFMD